MRTLNTGLYTFLKQRRIKTSYRSIDRQDHSRLFIIIYNLQIGIYCIVIHSMFLIGCPSLPTYLPVCLSAIEPYSSFLTILFYLISYRSSLFRPSWEEGKNNSGEEGRLGRAGSVEYGDLSLDTSCSWEKPDGQLRVCGPVLVGRDRQAYARGWQARHSSCAPSSV